MKNQKLYYSVQEYMQITGLSRSTVYRLVKKGELPIYRYSSRVLIPIQAVVGQGAVKSKDEE